MPTSPLASAPETPAAWLALDRQLCFALYSASLAMTRLYKPLLAPLGLTYPQYLVMLALWEADGVAVHQLGERLLLDSGTLTPLLKRLQQQGLVDRRRDPLDERRVLLWLTPAGRALRERARAVPARIGAAARCTAPELNGLRHQLTSLRTRLLEAGADAPALS